MSVINKEIIENLSDWVKNDDGTVEAVIAFPDSFAGFDGHFNNRPLLPGICKIITAMIILNKFKSHNLKIKRIKQAKFLAPVLPNEELKFVITEKILALNESIVKVIVTRSEVKVAKLELIIH